MSNFNGYGSADRLEQDKQCPKCDKTGGVHYMGSTVIRGNPLSPSADTEVDHHYRCTKCGKKWDESV